MEKQKSISKQQEQEKLNQKQQQKEDVDIEQPGQKKKKKKKKKKNNPQQHPLQQHKQSHKQQQQIILQALHHDTRNQDNSSFRLLGNWEQLPWRQTNPPTIPISKQFRQPQLYPTGQFQQYQKGKRYSDQQLRVKQLLTQERLFNLRKGAEVHRQVRKYAQTIIKPGRKLIDICNDIEAMNRFISESNQLKSGIAFPTGCSINHCAAHYTPNYGDFKTLQQNDVCKIDFGTHFNGQIIDSAFTVAFNPMYDQLLKSVKAATNAGIKAVSFINQAGIDARLGEVGAAIQEVMTSYQVILHGKTYPVKVVRNLNGHLIQPYKIHAGKSVPCVKSNNNTKMQQNECYAIQTFGSTGKGMVHDQGQCSHYMLDFYLPKTMKIPNKSKHFYNYINKKYSTLAWCKKWLDQDGYSDYILPLRDLVKNGIINMYPPLCDTPGCYVAQYEHTFLLRPNVKQILTRGDDY